MNRTNNRPFPHKLCFGKYFAAVVAAALLCVCSPGGRLYAADQEEVTAVGIFAPASLALGMIGFSVLLPDGPSDTALYLAPGEFRPLDDALSIAGSVGALATMGVAGVVAVLDAPLANVPRYTTTMAAAFFARSIAKRLIERPRPFAAEGTKIASADSMQSFPSGHAVMAWSAVGFSLASALGDRSALPALVASSSLALATSVLRILSGEHYVEDVVFGGILGLTIGAGVPILLDWLF